MRAELEALKLRNRKLARELLITRDKDRQLMRLTDAFYQHASEPLFNNAIAQGVDFDGISFIVVAYNIPRQLERTLLSLTPFYQECKPGEMEIIIIDNGSDTPLRKADFSRFSRVTKVIRIDGHPSPVHGLNRGIEAAQFSNVALMIDGAHMLTPGIVRNAKAVFQLMARPVINVPQYILGSASQNLRSKAGAFEQEAADLEALGWPANGYTLFDYALVPGENFSKYALDAIESNCLITSKEILAESGAYDERFDEPGAGLANIEIFTRLVNDPKNKYVTLAGEGSFHQDHGGTTTSLEADARDRLVASFYERYREITGDERNQTLRGPFVFGDVSAGNKYVPTISREYGKARAQVLRQLSEIYIDRVRFDQEGPVPSLTLKPVAADERKTRPILKPLGLENGKDVKTYGYRSILKKIHANLKPRRYFEIGVDDGGSISLARCPSVGVDPGCEITSPLPYPTRIFRTESDKFFADTALCEEVLADDVDLAFIDGMHLAEFVVRDFINVEKSCARGCTVVLDDVYPEQLVMAQRERKFNAWCGDVYKIIPILAEYRPDLEIHVFEAFAGPYQKGMAVVSGLDAGNTVLSDNYGKIEADIFGDRYAIETMDDLRRLVPTTPLEQLGDILRAIRPAA